MPTPQEIEIGDLFAQKLEDGLTLNEFEEVCKRNAAETDKNICHSHDFCDANEPMAEAFFQVMGHDIGTSTDHTTWNNAWNYAAVKYLGRAPYALIGSIQTEGGNDPVDLITLRDGRVLGISSDCVVLYDSMDAWETRTPSKAAIIGLNR